MSLTVRSVLLGFATGGRSSLGLALLAVTAPDTGGWPTSRWARGAAVLAAAGELTGDKLPQTPSRLAPPALASRIAVGAAAGAILAHREGASRTATLVSAGLAAAGAGLGSVAGARWRALAADRIGSDWPGALAEDALAISVARYAATA